MKLRATAHGLKFARDEYDSQTASTKHEMYEQVITVLSGSKGLLQSEVLHDFLLPFPITNAEHEKTRALFNGIIATWDMLRDEMMELGYIEWVK